MENTGNTEAGTSDPRPVPSQVKAAEPVSDEGFEEMLIRTAETISTNGACDTALHIYIRQAVEAYATDRQKGTKMFGEASRLRALRAKANAPMDGYNSRPTDPFDAMVRAFEDACMGYLSDDGDAEENASANEERREKLGALAEKVRETMGEQWLAYVGASLFENAFEVLCGRPLEALRSLRVLYDISNGRLDENEMDALGLPADVEEKWFETFSPERRKVWAVALAGFYHALETLNNAALLSLLTSGKGTPGSDEIPFLPKFEGHPSPRNHKDLMGIHHDHAMNALKCTPSSALYANAVSLSFFALQKNADTTGA